MELDLHKKLRVVWDDYIFLKKVEKYFKEKKFDINTDF